MQFLAVDHDSDELERFTSALHEAKPNADIIGVSSFDEACTLSEDEFDIVFIDPEAPSRQRNKITGMGLAAKMKSVSRNTHVIYTTGSRKFMSDAFAVHADAYMIKPVNVSAIQSELDYLTNYYPMPLRPQNILVRTFGGFSVYVNGSALSFTRSKAKELFAILVDRRGIGITTREACSLLFEDRPYDKIEAGYFHVILTSLRRTFAEAGVTNIILKGRNSISLNTRLIDCDAYRFLNGDADALKDYHGDYMMGYSWAEYSSEMFAERAEKNKRRSKTRAGSQR